MFFIISIIFSFFVFFFGQKVSIYILCDFWPYIVSFHEQKKFFFLDGGMNFF